MFTCSCGRRIQNTLCSIKQHEKTQIHLKNLEKINIENQWISQVTDNIAQTKREIKAATTIQWWWRRVSADPANHVGYKRMMKLFQEL